MFEKIVNRLKKILLVFDFKRFLILQKLEKRDLEKTNDLNLQTLQKKSLYLSNIYDPNLRLIVNKIKKALRAM